MNGMRGVFMGLDIAVAGMRTEMQRAEVVAANIGNMHVTRDADGGPYRRRVASVAEASPRQFLRALQGAERGSGQADVGARVVKVVEDRETPFVPRYDPGHPHADGDGFVLMSNVDVFKELVDMTVIQRSFQANLAAMRSYRGMLEAAVNNMRSR